MAFDDLAGISFLLRSQPHVEGRYDHLVTHETGWEFTPEGAVVGRRVPAAQIDRECFDRQPVVGLGRAQTGRGPAGLERDEVPTVFSGGQEVARYRNVDTDRRGVE